MAVETWHRAGMLPGVDEGNRTDLIDLAAVRNSAATSSAWSGTLWLVADQAGGLAPRARVGSGEAMMLERVGSESRFLHLSLRERSIPRRSFSG
jgi:hypothetical protein